MNKVDHVMADFIAATFKPDEIQLALEIIKMNKRRKAKKCKTNSFTTA